VDRMRAAKALQWCFRLLAAALFLHAIYNSLYVGPGAYGVSLDILPIIAGFIVLALGRAVRRRVAGEKPPPAQG